jgi:outer membrane protein insertion porin family
MTALANPVIAEEETGNCDPWYKSRPCIESVEFICMLPRCAEPEELQRFIRLSGLLPGEAFAEHQVDYATASLMETGLFISGGVSIHVEPLDESRVEIQILTEGQPFIRNVNIEAASALESDLEQRVFMRSGQPFNDDPDILYRQEDALRQIFLNDGYTEAMVTISSVEVGPYLYDLFIQVDEGERLDVQRIFFKGNEALSTARLRSTLLDEFGFIRTFTEADFQMGLERIISEYREEGYIRARIIHQEVVPRTESGGVDVFVEIREGPHWTFEFQGNSIFKNEELLESVRFYTTGFVDTAEIQSSTIEIKSLYLTEGYYFAEIEVNEERLDINQFVVQYTIDEGPLGEVREINISGNTAFTEGQLLNQISTREFGLLDAGGFLQPAQLEADIRSIESYYRRHGYLWANIPRWTVMSEEEGQSLFITLFVNEGPQTQVERITFMGNDVISTDTLDSATQMRPEQPFSPSRLEWDRDVIEQLYREQGYEWIRPQTQCSSGNEQSDCEHFGLPSYCRLPATSRCSTASDGDQQIEECIRIQQIPSCQIRWSEITREVEITHQLLEGELVTVGEIFVRGNFTTDAGVLRRELPLRTGDAYNRYLRLEGQRNIRSLGLFDSVTIEPLGLTEGSSEVSLMISVEEATSRYLEFRTGLSSQSTIDNNFLILSDTEGVFVNRNTLGQATELRTGGSFQFDLTNLDRVLDQEFVATAEISLFDPRFYFFGTGNRPWEFQTVLRGFWDLLSTPENQRDLTLTSQVLREFTELEGLFFSLEGKISFVQVRTVPVEEDFIDAFIVQVSPVFTVDRRNNPINPSQGFRAEFRLDLADDLLDQSFSRVQMQGSHFIPIGRHFVLGYHLNFGFAMGGLFSWFRFDETPDLPFEERLLLPPSEAFRLGGVSSIRGFPDNGVGPVTQANIPTFGDVVLNGSTELRFPLIPRYDLYGAYFFDMGQLQVDFIDFDLNEFRYSTGLGLRWLAFGLVPVVLDYGLILDRRPGEALGKLHFTVGYIF